MPCPVFVSVKNTDWRARMKNADWGENVSQISTGENVSQISDNCEEKADKPAKIMTDLVHPPKHFILKQTTQSGNTELDLRIIIVRVK